MFVAERWSFTGLKQEEQIQCRSNYKANGSMLDANMSFDLLSRTRMLGDDWLSASNELEPLEITEAIDRCIDLLEVDFGAISREKELDNADRVNFQLSAAGHHKDRQLGIQLGVLQGAESQ